MMKFTVHTARRALAVTVAAVALFGVSACSSGGEGEESSGPNGYSNAGALDGGVLWYDRSEETGMTDIIVFNDAKHRVGSCLGDVGTTCVRGVANGTPAAMAIAAPEVASVSLQWGGQSYEMVKGGNVAAEAPQVFAYLPPAVDGDPGAQFVAHDANGNEIALG